MIFNIGGKQVVAKVCPECGQEVLSLIIDLATGRRFCHLCADPNSTAATVTRKLHEHAIAGTLDQYPLAERIADLNGKKYVKPN
jgi:hypothetical protein